MRIKLSSVTTLTARNSSIWQVSLEKANTSRHWSAKSCSQFYMCCSTNQHCWTLFSHSIHAHVNTQICNALFSRMQRTPQKCKQNFGSELSTIAILMFAVLHVMLNSSALLIPDHKYPSPLTWIHRCTTLCNAPFSRRQSIPKLVHYNFGGKLSTVATLMFVMLHMLLNSFTLLKLVQSYHLHARQYTNMPPFAMHRFQGCRASLKSLWYI